MERTTKPMFAALQRELPIGDFLDEPKRDGLRLPRVRRRRRRRRGRRRLRRAVNRTHPAASRVQRLGVEIPATYVVFDVLARDGIALVDAPFREGRAR